MLNRHTTIFTRYNFVTNKIYWDFHYTVQPSGTYTVTYTLTFRSIFAALNVHRLFAYINQRSTLANTKKSWPRWIHPHSHEPLGHAYGRRKNKISGRTYCTDWLFLSCPTIQWIRNSRHSYTKFVRRTPIYVHLFQCYISKPGVYHLPNIFSFLFSGK